VRKQRIETPTERWPWLIIIATIPVESWACSSRIPLRVLFAKPLAASIFLMVNGCILLGAERLPGRAEVRELAQREGAKARRRARACHDGVPGGGADRVAQSSALIAASAVTGYAWPAASPRARPQRRGRFAFLLATPPILAAGVLKIGDLTGPLGGGGIRSAALIAAIAAAITAVLSVRF